jgi:hypothetical protein
MRVVYSLMCGEEKTIPRVWTIDLGRKGLLHVYYTDGRKNFEKVLKRGRDFDHLVIYLKWKGG